MNLLNKTILLLLLLLPIITLFGASNKVYVSGEDAVEEEDEEVIVDDSNPNPTPMEETPEEPEVDESAKGSPDVDTVILFTNPVGHGKELAAGKLVEFLVGFTNNGDGDFVVDAVDASFRYPMDFSFFIQNFTAIQFHRTVKPNQEATFMYSFYPAEAFAGRPLGLTINLNYRNADNDMFVESLFNQTVSITEVEEGLDGETFFLYVFLLALGVLALLGGHHLLSTYGRKRLSVFSRKAKKQQPEEDLDKQAAIDSEWITSGILAHHGFSSKRNGVSPKQRSSNNTSPKQRGSNTSSPKQRVSNGQTSPRSRR